MAAVSCSDVGVAHKVGEYLGGDPLQGHSAWMCPRVELCLDEGTRSSQAALTGLNGSTTASDGPERERES